MAIGQYVKTLAGAVSRGARAIAAAVLQRGGSGPEAAAALSQAFPSLSGQVIGGLVSGTRNQLASGQRGFQGGALFGAPALEIAAIGDIPTAERRLIRVTVTGEDSGAQSISNHWVDLQPGEGDAEALRKVQERMSLILGGSRSPDLLEDVEGEEVDVEYETVAIQQRQGG